MAKEQGKKQNSAPSKAKKGSVINRRANRTVSEGFAKSEPKWENVGHGVLVRKGTSVGGSRSNPIHLAGPTFSSVSYKDPAPKNDVWVGVGVPQPPPSAAGLPQEM